MRALAMGLVLLLSASASMARMHSETETSTQRAESLDIYVVRGTAENLKRFQSEVGESWKGGTFLRRFATEKEYRYWAYPTREAREARVFMFGTLSYNLQFDIEAYDQSKAYPSEREVLDGIVERCGSKSDPFLIHPDRQLRFKPDPEEKFEVVDCLLSELRKSTLLDDMPIGFVGNEAPVEDDK